METTATYLRTQRRAFGAVAATRYRNGALHKSTQVLHTPKQDFATHIFGVNIVRLGPFPLAVLPLHLHRHPVQSMVQNIVHQGLVCAALAG